MSKNRAIEVLKELYADLRNSFQSRESGEVDEIASDQLAALDLAIHQLQSA